MRESVSTIYAIGDIHGRLDLLRELHQVIVAHARRHGSVRNVVVYLGDYVSRGKDSRGVIAHVMAWRPLGFTRVFLKGNHEDLLLRFVDGELEAGSHWFDYGGLDTLASYGVRLGADTARDVAILEARRAAFAAALPADHLTFLRNLSVAFAHGGYFYVHGGVRPGVALDAQSEHDCIWIRNAFLKSRHHHGATVVHGHSIVDEPEIHANRIAIDTGAYRSGVLTALAVHGGVREFLQTGVADAQLSAGGM